jgi:hypothetical protein
MYARDLLDPREYETPPDTLLFEKSVFMIAAIDSGRLDTLKRVTTIMHVILPFSSDYVVNVHFAGRNFLGIDPTTIMTSDYDGTLWRHGVNRELCDACHMGNVAAVVNLFAIGSGNREDLCTLCGDYWTGHQEFSRSVADELYRQMKAADLDFIETISDQSYFDTDVWKTLAPYMIRKEGKQYIRNIEGFLTVNQWLEIRSWLDSVIENDDVFWADIGLI